MPTMKLTPKIRKRFAANLKKRRMALPMEKGKNGHFYPVGVKKLAVWIGVSGRQLFAWENAEESASLDSVEKVARYYGVHEGELLR